MNEYIEQHYRDQVLNLEHQIEVLKASYVLAEKKTWLAEKKSAQDAQVARNAEGRTVAMQQERDQMKREHEAMQALVGIDAYEVVKTLETLRKELETAQHHLKEKINENWSLQMKLDSIKSILHPDDDDDYQEV